jgi:hypothetical protein
MFGAQVSNATVIRKRQESEALFVLLSGQHVETLTQRPADERTKAFAYFVVGGVTVAELSAIVDAFGKSGLFRD